MRTFTYEDTGDVVDLVALYEHLHCLALPGKRADGGTTCHVHLHVVGELFRVYAECLQVMN